MGIYGGMNKYTHLFYFSLAPIYKGLRCKLNQMVDCQTGVWFSGFFILSATLLLYR